jgi:hypothetical protein
VWERAWNNLITWDLGPAFLVQDHQKTGRRIKKKTAQAIDLMNIKVQACICQYYNKGKVRSD